MPNTCPNPGDHDRVKSRPPRSHRQDRLLACWTHKSAGPGFESQPPTDRTIARTGSVPAVLSPPGTGVRGPGIRNTGMTPSSVMRTSATKASMAALR